MQVLDSRDAREELVVLSTFEFPDVVAARARTTKCRRRSGDPSVLENFCVAGSQNVAQLVSNHAWPTPTQRKNKRGFNTQAAAVAWSCLVSRLEDAGLRSRHLCSPPRPGACSQCPWHCPQLRPSSMGSPLGWPHLRCGAACARGHFPGASPPIGAWCCWPDASSARAPCRCSLAGGS